jgi:type II secretory pathway pseudopilin PulG
MKRQSQRGFSLLEMMAALAIGMFMLLGLSTLLDSSLQDTKSQQTAQHQVLFSGAAKRYLDDNYTNLLAAPNPVGTTVAVTLATLQAPVAYLPPSFTAKNAYQQTPCMLVRKNTATQLEVLLVTEGGTPIPDADIGYVAANANTGGGAITYVTPKVPASGLIARGAYGSWMLDNTSSVPSLSDFTAANCSGTPADNGHLATALFYGVGQTAADFLYRNPNGNPAYNTMSTPIGMANAAIKVIDTACGPTAALAVDLNGHMLTCDLTTNKWADPLTNSTWKAPVASYATLPPVATTKAGDVYATLDTGRAYMSNGGGWTPLALDQNGSMTMEGNLTMNGTPGVPGGTEPSGTGNVIMTGDVGARTVYLTGNLDMQKSFGYIWGAYSFMMPDGWMAVGGTIATPNVIQAPAVWLSVSIPVGTACPAIFQTPEGVEVNTNKGTLALDIDFNLLVCRPVNPADPNGPAQFLYTRPLPP